MTDEQKRRELADLGRWLDDDEYWHRKRRELDAKPEEWRHALGPNPCEEHKAGR